MFEKINEKKVILDASRPLLSYTLKSLREKLFLEWTYYTSAIEGNTLTLNERQIKKLTPVSFKRNCNGC